MKKQKTTSKKPLPAPLTELEKFKLEAAVQRVIRLRAEHGNLVLQFLQSNPAARRLAEQLTQAETHQNTVATALYECRKVDPKDFAIDVDAGVFQLHK